MTIWQYVVKVAVTAVLVVAVSELSKRSSLMGAVLASVPVLSVLAMVWLYHDTRDVEQVASLSRDILWLVLPSLALFVVLPLLLGRGVAFYPSLAVAIAATITCYFVAIAISRGIQPWFK